MKLLPVLTVTAVLSIQSTFASPNYLIHSGMESTEQAISNNEWKTIDVAKKYQSGEYIITVVRAGNAADFCVYKFLFVYADKGSKIDEAEAKHPLCSKIHPQAAEFRVCNDINNTSKSKLICLNATSVKNAELQIKVDGNIVKPSRPATVAVTKIVQSP